MFGFKKSFSIKVETGSNLTIDFAPKEKAPMYDLCDYNGNLVDSGRLKAIKTELNIKDLAMGIYYLFILDGPHIYTKKFSI